MAPVLQCPECGTKHPLDSVGAGSAFPCSGCGRTLKVPAAGRAMVPPRPPVDAGSAAVPRAAPPAAGAAAALDRDATACSPPGAAVDRPPPRCRPRPRPGATGGRRPDRAAPTRIASPTPDGRGRGGAPLGPIPGRWVALRDVVRRGAARVPRGVRVRESARAPHHEPDHRRRARRRLAPLRARSRGCAVRRARHGGDRARRRVRHRPVPREPVAGIAAGRRTRQRAALAP